MFTFPVDSVKNLVGGLGPHEWVFASVPAVYERTDPARQVADRGESRFRSGERVIDNAQALSVDKVTVIDHLNRAEVEHRPRGMSEGQVDEEVRLYASGLSLARVGERLGFSAPHHPHDDSAPRHRDPRSTWTGALTF